MTHLLPRATINHWLCGPAPRREQAVLEAIGEVVVRVGQVWGSGITNLIIGQN